MLGLQLGHEGSFMSHYVRSYHQPRCASTCAAWLPDQ